MARARKPKGPKRAAPKKVSRAARKAPSKTAAKSPRRPALKPAKPCQASPRAPKRLLVKDLRKLAKKPWGKLTKAQQTALRAWRGRRAAETRTKRYYDELIARLQSDSRKERVTARAELRADRDTRGMARYLKRYRRFTAQQIKEAIAFWFYAPA